MKTPRRINNGVAAEYAFATKLLTLGYMPCWPSSNSLPYDLVVYIGDQARRIQVKSSIQETVNLNFSRQSRQAGAYVSTADIIALWIETIGAWYIIPTNQIKTKGIRLSPRSVRCKWRKFKEAWHLIK